MRAFCRDTSNHHPNICPVLLCFEYLITMDREIELFWKLKFSSATALFLTNRYLIVMYPALLILGQNFETITWTESVSLHIAFLYSKLNISTL